MIEGNKEHKELVVNILVSAFKDLKEDNSINFIVGYGNNRIEKLKHLMGYLFELSILFGEVYISSNKKSCLLVAHSSKEKVTLKTILLDIQLFIKVIGFKKLFKVLKRQKLVKQFYPKNEDYIKPVIMGSVKEAYGNGSAARLVLTVMHKYKENKKPVIVDTTALYNVKLYQKFGFRILNEEKAMGYLTLLRLN